MTPGTYRRLIHFLEEDLAISPDCIAVAERSSNLSEEHHRDASSLLMTLWQYGLVSLDQLDKIFDWLERV